MASGSNPPPEDAGEGPGDSAPKFGVGERLTVPGEGEDGVNLNNYQFSFQQNHLDAGTGKSVFIEADVRMQHLTPATFAWTTLT